MWPCIYSKILALCVNVFYTNQRGKTFNTSFYLVHSLFRFIVVGTEMCYFCIFKSNYESEPAGLQFIVATNLLLPTYLFVFAHYHFN